MGSLPEKNTETVTPEMGVERDLPAVKPEPKKEVVVPPQPRPLSDAREVLYPLASEENFKAAYRMARMYAASALVPPDFRGEQNVPNVMTALEMASRLGYSPLQMMLNINIIYGKPSFSSQFIIAQIQRSGRFSTLQYRFNEEGTSCVAYATELATGNVVEGPEISMDIAMKEGWATKGGSKWKTMPQIMLRYRAATLFGRFCAPDALMGMQSSDELDDIGADNGYAAPKKRGQSKVIAKLLNETGEDEAAPR